MKRKKILISMLIAGCIMSFPIVSKAYLKNNVLDAIDKHKVLDMDFNNNKIINTINKKEYTASKNTYKYASSVKGNGFEANSSKINIPFRDLGITDADKNITISFIFKYDGVDKDFVPISIGDDIKSNALWFNKDKLGFNSGKGDLYGINSPFKKGEFVSVVLEFYKDDITKNKMYINGQKQNLTYMLNNTSANPSWDVNSTLSIGGFLINDNYVIDDKSIIDEIKVFKGTLNDEQILNISNSHKIPELRGEVINGNTPNVKLNWATEILPENVLWKIGFEDIEQSGIDLVYHSGNGLGNGNQEFKINNGFSGDYSAYTPNSYPDKGNSVAWPFDRVSEYNHIWFRGKQIGLKNNIPVSASFRLKGEGNIKVAIFSDWRYNNVFKYYNSVFQEDYPIGTKRIKVSNLNLFSLGSHITVDPVVTNHELNNSVKEIDTKSGELILASPLNYSVKKGDKLKYRVNSKMFSFPNLSTKGTGEWQLFNLNGKTTNPENYNWEENKVMLRQQWTSDKYAYIDDLTVGHATKVRLYRDNVKIYEGYESELNDTSSKDKVKPTEVDNIRIEMTPSTTDRKVKFKFNPAIDKGSFYNYNISAVDNKGVETPKSKTQTIEVNSGIKGYSYVINKHSNTEPSNTVNTTSTELEYTIPANESGDYYLHIKAIDNEGNVSNTMHHKLEVPKLTVVPKHSENMIRLDWTDMKDNTYKVFQKKPGDTEFQSISSTDMEATKSVKTLLVYPDTSCNLGDLPNTTYIDKNGEEITIPVSASLKKWMEEPNSENSNGYGKGIIKVDLVNLKDYNENPSSFIKNSNGEYIYDVIVFGIADCNGSQAINELAEIETSKFIESGRGILFGHDTIYDSELRLPFLNLAKKYAGINIVRPSEQYRDTQVRIRKKGLLTNYPWNIGEVGTILTTPLSHTSLQVPDDINNIWLNYANGEDVLANVYLTTKNNTAMIQTGHSNGQATPDEQKILANTLFYLNQLSADNFLNDYSGQDVTAPNKPSVLNHSIEEDFININLNKTEDNGSDYQYYVEAENKSGSKIHSNIAKANIKTGFKGYSYVIDTKENTEPDNKIETSENNLKMKINNNQMYLHIKAIDNVGNESETLHFKVEDLVKPTLEFEINPNGYTKDNVLINVIAKDVGSGVKEIVLPNGEVIKGTKASFTATQNGVYTFIATDKMNNKTVQSITISNIDREKPTITITNNKNWTNQNVQINISATD